MRQRPLTVMVLLSLCLLVLSSLPNQAPINAGGPLIVTKSGTPYVWDTSQPVTFTPDQGPLGVFSNADAVALTNDLFQVWASVPTATIRFEPAGQLATDITGTNVMEFFNTVPNTINPIIFDTDGSVTDALIGRGARILVLGFAGPARVEDRYIRQALGVLNGLWIDGQRASLTNPETSLEMFRTAFVHEFGHFSGLDHSALNTPQAFDNDPTNDDTIPTMFPQLVSPEQATLHLDDVAALSTLYPTAEFLATTGVIRGQVLFPDGAPFQGANVIARNVADPLHTAVSSVSGFLHTGSRANFGSDDPQLLGLYELSGLPPGTYTVEISSIPPQFRGGSSVGPVDPPVSLPGTPQFYTGPGQPGSPNPDAAVPVSVPAGSVVELIDITVTGRILSVGTLQGRQGVMVEIPMGLTDPSGIAAMAFSLSFDPRILSLVESATIRRGPPIPSNFTVNVSEAGDSRVRVSISPPFNSLTATLNPIPGTLLWIRFRVTQAQPGSMSRLTLSNVTAFRPHGERVNLILQDGSLTVIPFR